MEKINIIKAIPNFPFLESTIDGLSYYQLLSALNDYVNKLVDEVNSIGGGDTQINALQESVNKINELLGNEALKTTAVTITEAVNELVNEITDSQKNIGNLTALTTNNKESLVKAINEVNAKPTGGSAAISNSTNITTTGQFALDAVQNNAAIENTLRNLINKLQNSFNNFSENTGKTLTFNSSQPKSIVTSQFVELDTLLNVDTGTWLIQILTNFESNGNGKRIAWLKNNHSYNSGIVLTVNAFINSSTDVNGVGIFVCNENNTELTIQVYQDSGVTLNLSKYSLVAVKLK